jgi:predicted exporter
VNPISEIRRLRQKYTDQLLTLLALFIALEMFVFSPLQAMGIFAFQGFVVATLLAILAGMLIISDRPVPFAVMADMPRVMQNVSLWPIADMPVAGSTEIAELIIVLQRKIRPLSKKNPDCLQACRRSGSYRLSAIRPPRGRQMPVACIFC